MKANHWWREPVINRRAWTWEDSNAKTWRGQWWQNAVIYQICPWSFSDTTGNGSGDLQGIINKLSYIHSLGVEALWLTPITPSRHEDIGYDPTKLNDIDPLLGNLDTFRRLLSVAHGMGMKVITDLVINHTSSGHPWFTESASSRDNPKADWYVWADADEGGNPPNNWLSAFTGETSWIWHEKRQQFYLANFLTSQPDLNWHNDDVISALMQNMRFWLDLGIDGFRVDAVNFLLHDEQLRDNPARKEGSIPDGVAMDNPLASQEFCNSFCRDETIDKLRHIRAVMNDYPGTVTLGEVTLCEDSVALSAAYVKGDDRLHLAYNSALLWDAPLSPARIRRALERTREHFTDGGQCWMVGNHDYERLRSRWTGRDENGQPYSDPFYKMVAALLLSLPGALCIYQGDELGLPLARVPEDIPPEKLQDPFGKAMYPKLPGRDGSRTPMPWHGDEKHAGFTTAEEPWLPVPESHYERSVNLQNSEPTSLLNTWRKLLHWRKAQPALIAGDCELLEQHPQVFACKRKYAEQTIYCYFNISEKQQTYPAPPEKNALEKHVLTVGDAHYASDRDILIMAPYAAVFVSYTEH